MNIRDIEKKVMELYSRFTNISIDKLNTKLDKLANIAPTKDNVIKIFETLKFRISFLEILPHVLSIWLSRKFINMYERVNNYRKKYDINKIIKNKGGAFVPSSVMVQNIQNSGINGKVIDYYILSSSFTTIPTTYQTIGSPNDIKSPETVYVINGRSIKEFKHIIKVELTDDVKSVFCDVAGCDVKIVGNSLDNELNDGITSISIDKGVYNIEITPRFIGDSFNILVRQIIFTNDVESQDEYTYTHHINVFSTGLQFINPSQSTEVEFTFNGKKGVDTLSLGELNNSLYYYVPIDGIIDSKFVPHFISPYIGRIVSPPDHDIIHGSGILVSEQLMNKCRMFYVDDKGFTIPSMSKSYTLYRIFTNYYEQIIPENYEKEFIISQKGLYCIKLDSSSTMDITDQTLLNQISLTDILVPCYCIDKNVLLYNKGNSSTLIKSLILSSVMSSIGGTADIYFQNRNFENIDGELVVKTNKPIEGIIIVSG